MKQYLLAALLVEVLRNHPLRCHFLRHVQLRRSEIYD